jgi:hypothetical protein
VVGLEALLLDSLYRLALEGKAKAGEQEAATGDEFLRDPVNRTGRNLSASCCHHGISVARKR